MSDIKITMLGTSGAGKTCFLLGMYAEMSEGKNGFTFSTQDPDLAQELSDRWEKLKTEQGSGRWPVGNDNAVQEYRFNFEYGFHKLLGFEWIDYRGAALNGRSQEADVAALYQQVQGSASLFLCISGKDLAQSQSIQQIRDKVHTREINKFLSSLQKRDHQPSIAVVITKYDHCRNRDKEEVYALIRELFSPLFVDGAEWLVTICPVSLGEGLTENLDAAEIKPLNLHLPVAFAIYSELKQRIADTQRQKAAAEAAGEQMGRTFFGRLFNRPGIRDNENLRSFLERRRKKLESDLELLSSELIRGTALYYNGGKVELDV